MDRIRKLYPLAAVFAPGEMPTAAKLTGISTQSSGAFTILEKALGDLWNQAGDPVLSPALNITKNALHITSVGRAIGQMSLLNSMVPGQGPLSGSMTYTDHIGNNFSGEVVARLKYRPATPPNSGNMILGNTFAPLVQVQYKGSPKLLATSGDWHVTDDGKLYTFNPIPIGLTLTYSPTILSDVKNSYGNSSPAWNVIPDPSTWSGNYQGVKISFANNTDSSTGFHIWLPPRKGLSNGKIIATSPDVSDNEQASPDVGTLRAFQLSTADASMTNGSHYRYNFPDEITQQAANASLPGNFVFVWDETTGTIIEGLSLYTPANIAHSQFKIRVVGANAEAVFGNTLGNGIITSDLTQIPGDYKSRFKVITTGASLAKALHSLYLDHFNHKHSASDGSASISHADLSDNTTPGRTAFGQPGWPASNWANDDHIQYLHRGGSVGDATQGRDLYDNAIWTQLLIASVHANQAPTEANTVGDITTRHAIQILQTPVGGLIGPLDQSNTLKLQTFGATAFIKMNPSDGNIGNIELDTQFNNIIRIKKGTVDKLYFADTGITSLPDDYLTFDNFTHTYKFVADEGGINKASVQAWEFTGEVANFQSVFAGMGPFFTGFRYRKTVLEETAFAGYPGKEQYYSVTPLDFRVSSDGVLPVFFYESVGGVLPTDVQKYLNYIAPSGYGGGMGYVQGNQYGGPIVPGFIGLNINAFAQVRLPHKSILDGALSTFKINYECGTNSILIVKMYSRSLYDPSPSTASLIYHYMTNVSGNNIVEAHNDLGLTHIIDNTENTYIIQVTLGAVMTPNTVTTKFRSGTIKYYIQEVNN